MRFLMSNVYYSIYYVWTHPWISALKSYSISVVFGQFKVWQPFKPEYQSMEKKMTKKSKSDEFFQQEGRRYNILVLMCHHQDFKRWHQVLKEKSWMFNSFNVLFWSLDDSILYSKSLIWVKLNVLANHTPQTSRNEAKSEDAAKYQSQEMVSFLNQEYRSASVYRNEERFCK